MAATNLGVVPLLEVWGIGVLEDMSLASSVLKDTFSSPWPWPCDYRSVKFSVTRIDRYTYTAEKKVLMIRAKTVISELTASAA